MFFPLSKILRFFAVPTHLMAHPPKAYEPSDVLEPEIAPTTAPDTLATT